MKIFIIFADAKTMENVGTTYGTQLTTAQHPCIVTFIEVVWEEQMKKEQEQWQVDVTLDIIFWEKIPSGKLEYIEVSPIELISLKSIYLGWL